MRLSGVLPEDDDGSTDLATLERRLADRAGRSMTPRASMDDRRASIAPQTGHSTTNGTPVQPALPSPRSGTATPELKEPEAADKEEDALAEMMCSLVTNNCGETRYIGQSCLRPPPLIALTWSRLILGLLHLLTQGHTMGE